MVVADPHFGWSLFGPTEDDSPLVIDAYRMEPCQISAQGFQLVARWHGQIFWFSGLIYLDQLAQRDSRDSLKTTAVLLMEDLLRIFICEGLDH